MRARQTRLRWPLAALLAAAVGGCGAPGEERTSGAPPAADIAVDTRSTPSPAARASGTGEDVGPGDAPRALSQYVHRVWTADDGLPHTAVGAIAQTADGALWVGTQGGAARFDGVRFVPVTARDGLPNNTVNALHAAPDGALWMGTFGGLVRYVGGRLTDVVTTNEGLPDDTVWDVAVESDGTVWAATLGGLARLRDGRISVFTEADGLPTSDVRAVSLGPDGAVWAGTYGGGASRIEGDRVRSWSLADSPAGPWLHTLLAGRRGVWVGVGQGQGDRSAYQLLGLEGGQFEPVPPGPAVPSVRALLEDREGSLWAGTYGGGVVRFRDGEIETLTPAEGLSGDRVSALFEDREGTVWVGTAGGLDALRPRSAFTTIAAAEGLPDDNVRAVAEGAAGEVWVATANGLGRIDPEGTAAITAADGLPEPFVHALWAGQDEVLWLGGRHSVTRYADGEFRRFALPAAWPEALVRSITEDATGRLWLGSAGAGLIRFAPGEWTARTEEDGLAHNTVTVLLPAADGGLWVGTVAGLSRLSGGHLHPFPGQEAFEGVNVRSLYEDADGTLWVGTYGRGLMRLRGGQAATLTTRDGLHDDGAWAILEDATGRLWMSSNRGVSAVPKEALHAVADGRADRVEPVVYGTADGMKTAEANGASKPSGGRSADGRMWFATQEGVIIVDPERAGRPAPAPVVGDVRSRDGVVARAGTGVALPARARDLTVTYAGADPATADGLRFRYRLDPFTDGWVEAGGRREAVFTNVPAGRYAFRVAAGRTGEAWAEATPLAISVAPFLWETWWFRLLAAVAAVALLASAVRAQARRQGRREAVLEAKVASRTERLREAVETMEAQADRLKDLDRLKSRFFANVSHEFRTPLTLTLGPLDDVLAGEYGPVPDEAAEPIGLARRSAGRVLALINQILDVSRLEAGHTPLRARRFDLGAFARTQAEAFVPLAAHRRVAVGVDAPDAPLWVWADPEHLGVVLANLLSNAFKFTPGGGTVTVEVGDVDGRAHVVVRDTGPGIAAADLPHIFDRFYQAEGGTGRPLGSGIGLALAHELTRLHGGTLTAESAVGEGSAFTLALPLGRDHLTPEQVDDQPWEGAVAVPLNEVDDELASSAPPECDADDVTTVLVADDQADIRAFVRRHLEGAGYRVVEAADGEEALDRARKELPDLVVSDVMMPRLDGLGLCRALRSDPETDFLPVLLLTAKAAPEDRLDGLAELCDDYLTKPFDVRELVARVDNLIALRRRLHERFAGAGGDGALGAPPASADDAFVVSVRAAIEAGLPDDAFNVGALADAVGLSRSHLLRKTTELLDATPSDLIRTARLDRAAGLLAARAGTVSEVAYGVGFKSVAHFSNAFLAHTGSRPSAYAEAVE